MFPLPHCDFNIDRDGGAGFTWMGIQRILDCLCCLMVLSKNPEGAAQSRRAGAALPGPAADARGQDGIQGAKRRGRDARQVRNRVVALPGVQSAVVAASRRGLLPKAVWARLQPIDEVEIPVPIGDHRFVYVSDPADIFARNVCWAGFRYWETSTVEYTARAAPDLGCFWDVGAHTGIYSLLVSAVNPRCTVVAFEPNPGILPHLLKNLDANGFGNVEVESVALSDRNGGAHLSIPADTTAAEISRIGAPIETRRADDLDCRRPQLVKMDVEGHELQAIAGMEKTLIRHHPALIIEVRTGRLDHVRSQLGTLGYSTCEYFSRGGLVDADGPFDRDPTFSNFLFK